MTILKLFHHHYLQTFRSQGFYKNTLVNIIMGLFMLYMAGTLLLLGFLLDNLLEDIHIGLNPVEMVGCIFLYLIPAGILLRIPLQQLQKIHIHTYKHLPISQRTLNNYIIITPLINPLKYLLLFFMIPFAIQGVSRYYDAATATCFVLCMLCIVWLNVMITNYLKRCLSSDWIAILIVLALMGIPIALELLNIMPCSHISCMCMMWIISHPYSLIIILALVAGVYMLNYSYLSTHPYIESFAKKETINVNTSQWRFLNHFGEIGDIINMEIKLILRHKRTKTILYLSAFFMLYGLLFYISPMYENSPAWLYFCAMFITGILMLMFGQWIISWNSSHFDGLMTNNISVPDYIKANLYMMQASCIACYIIASPYFIIGWHIVAYHTAACLFNMGVISYLLIYFATYNTKRINLSNNSSFNYQGTTYKNFLIVMPVMFGPMLIVGLLKIWINVYIILSALALIGIIGLCMHKPIVNKCILQFNQRKYALMEGFRQSE